MLGFGICAEGRASQISWDVRVNKTAGSGVSTGYGQTVLVRHRQRDASNTQ